MWEATLNALDLASFGDAWARWYDVEPFGHALRVAYSDRWVRIHTLPRGKRYAETEAERREIAKRYEAAGKDVLGTRAECTLVGYGYGGEAALPADHPLAACFPQARRG